MVSDAKRKIEKSVTASPWQQLQYLQHYRQWSGQPTTQEIHYERSWQSLLLWWRTHKNITFHVEIPTAVEGKSVAVSHVKQITEKNTSTRCEQSVSMQSEKTETHCVTKQPTLRKHSPKFQQREDQRPSLQAILWEFHAHPIFTNDVLQASLHVFLEISSSKCATYLSFFGSTNIPAYPAITKLEVPTVSLALRDWLVPRNRSLNWSDFYVHG